MKKYKLGQHYHDQDADWLKHPFPTMTPKKQQWQQVKEAYPKHVLLMKIGKFYEAFHSCADVLHEQLEAPYMEGIVAHTGFPETQLSAHRQTLIDKGYKVIEILK